DQMKTIVFPEGSLMGDWKRGERIAQNGRGLQWTDKPGDAAGGSCYNCHQLSPQEASFGTLGPSLRQFGKLRGNGQEIQRYVYDFARFGNVSLLHRTDVHGRLLPVYFREPSMNLGTGQAPHLVGEHFLRQYNVKAGSSLAHALTHLDFENAARRYGKVGGFAHLATLVKRLRASRPLALLLDGGDSWQGSATSLWTRGADMIGAQKLLGVDCMTAHWEFTYGAERVRQAAESELAPIEFLAQNVRTLDFEEPVFKPYTLRSVKGVPVAVVGQAFTYTPIANPRHLVPDWTFVIQGPHLKTLLY